MGSSELKKKEENQYWIHISPSLEFEHLSQYERGKGVSVMTVGSTAGRESATVSPHAPKCISIKRRPTTAMTFKESSFRANV